MMDVKLSSRRYHFSPKNDSDPDNKDFWIELKTNFPYFPNQPNKQETVLVKCKRMNQSQEETLKNELDNIAYDYVYT